MVIFDETGQLVYRMNGSRCLRCRSSRCSLVATAKMLQPYFHREKAVDSDDNDLRTTDPGSQTQLCGRVALPSGHAAPSYRSRHPDHRDIKPVYVKARQGLSLAKCHPLARGRHIVTPDAHCVRDNSDNRAGELGCESRRWRSMLSPRPGAWIITSSRPLLSAWLSATGKCLMRLRGQYV